MRVDVATALRNRFEARGTVVPAHDPTPFVLWFPGGPIRADAAIVVDRELPVRRRSVFGPLGWRNPNRAPARTVRSTR